MADWLSSIKTWSFDLGNTLCHFTGNSPEAIEHTNQLLLSALSSHDITIPDPDLFLKTYHTCRYNRRVRYNKLGKENRYIYPALADTFQELDLPIPSKEVLIDIVTPSANYRFSPENLHLYPYTSELLAKLKEKGYQIILISNIPEMAGEEQLNFAHHLLDHYNLTQFFDHLILSGSLEICKPNPLIFEEAIKLTSSLPSEIVHIGDDYEADILGGSKSGFKTIWLSDGKKIPETFDNPSSVVTPSLSFSSPDELYQWVAKNLN